MCHQTVGLVQAEIERRGIATASVTVMPEITGRVAPPRALVVAAALGAPMGAPGDRRGQDRRLRRMLALLARRDVPVLADEGPSGNDSR